MWNDIHEKSVPSDSPVVVRQCNGIVNFGCYHSGQSSGIIKLFRDGDEFKWDGRTFLLKVTHWREITLEDLKGTQPFEEKIDDVF